MSVAEIGQLHNRYVRLSDKFKAAWTYNQFVGGVFKNILQQPLPYKVDFQKLYEEIKKAGDTIQTSIAASATPVMERCERELQHVFKQLLEADNHVGASILRRFFEKLRTQDEKIIFNLVKFYLYGGAITGERRDKLDFLFTRLAEDFLEERGEYGMRDQSELRRVFQGLLAAGEFKFPPPEQVDDIARMFRANRDEVLRSAAFDELTDNNLLGRSRDLKAQAGEAFFHPDVLLAIVDCNITTKNRFARLYRDEEHRIIEDARRLMENEQAIARGFGQSNPELLDEMTRFKQFKHEFDASRAQSNVKHNVIAQLKASMNTILHQLDRGLDAAGEVEEISEDFFVDGHETDAVEARFGDDPLLHPYLSKIVSVIDSFDAELTTSRISHTPAVKNLRLEPWEIGAFEKLYWQRQRSQGETDELLLLFLRAAALRLKIDEEAREIADMKDVNPPPALLEKVRVTLDRAKEFDDTFKDYLQEGIYSSPKNIHRLYRSRLRLLRAYSGLWLVYDQHSPQE